MALAHQMLRFGVVGVVGFSVDGGLLWALVSNGASPYFARAFSFPAAVVTTWWLNRIWTFTQSDKARPRRQLNLYLALQVLGGLANFAVYFAILTVIAPTPLNALGALAVGAVVGMIINFVGSRQYIFRAAAPVRTEQ
jgi:putative flippase GtrA